jgi:signal transduction histidine kinase
MTNDTDLINMVAHDLKVPVTAAKGFLDLVENLGELNAAQVQYLNRANLALQRMERMITNMLDYAHLRDGIQLHFETVDFHKLIQSSADLVAEIARERKITLHHKDGAAPLMVPVDVHLMGHVVTNLLSNALKYNDEGGNVWIDNTTEPDWLICRVRDDGFGISEENQKHIFERFYRGHTGQRRDGTGLGLAIAKAIIELHGGTIWVESTPDEGSTFSFKLPLVQ